MLPFALLSPFKEEVRNSCGGCGEPPLKAVTGEELERKRGMEEECGGRGGKGGGLQRIAGTGPSPDWSRMISLKLGYCDKKTQKKPPPNHQNILKRNCKVALFYFTVLLHCISPL